MKSPILLTVHPPGYQTGHPYYTLCHTESDTSRLDYQPGVGTILDKSLPRDFEFQVHERDASGYRGCCGQYENFNDAVIALLAMAEMSLDENPPFKGEFRTD